MGIVKFHDVELLGEQEGDTVWIPIKPICDAIGVRGEDQIRAISNDEVLGAVRGIRPVHDASGRIQDMVCLPIHHVHGWLFGIQASKVRAEARPRLILFKQECYTVLYEHFFGNARRLQADAEREHYLLGRNKEINRKVRQIMAEQATNKLELQAIQNRRALTYHLEPLNVGVEAEYEKRTFLGQQLKVVQ